MKSAIVAIASLVFTASAAVAGGLPEESGPVASWFGYLEGGYVFPTNSHTRQYSPALVSYDQARTGEGGYGSGKLGYRFNGVWDAAVGFKYLDQSSGRINEDLFGWQMTDGHYWNLDVEVGYHLSRGDWSLRPFAGLRYQEYSADFTDHAPPKMITAYETSWGVGPRVGFDVTRNIGKHLSFFGSADASILFGKAKVDRHFPLSIEFSDSRTFATVGMKAGLAWEFTPGVKLGAGYQMEYLSSIGYKNFWSADAVPVPEGKASQLMHGPFMRLSFNY